MSDKGETQILQNQNIIKDRNEFQTEIAKSLNNNQKFQLIFGPPGMGKTYEIVNQIVTNPNKNIIASALTNPIATEIKSKDKNVIVIQPNDDITLIDKIDVKLIENAYNFSLNKNVEQDKQTLINKINQTKCDSFQKEQSSWHTKECNNKITQYAESFNKLHTVINQDISKITQNHLF